MCLSAVQQVYDASAPFDANAVPLPTPREAVEAPVMPGHGYELAPDVPAEPERLEAVIEDAEQYERVFEEGEMRPPCVPAPTPPPGPDDESVSDDDEQWYIDNEDPCASETVHYYGPGSYERERYPYGDYGYPYDPSAGMVIEVADEETRASARVLEQEKEDETALIAAIMEEVEEDKSQYMVTTSTLWSC